MSDGKRCKCITNHWRTLECIVMHSKCVEMHSNANFVKPVFPKDGHKKRSNRDFLRMLIVMSVKPTLTDELLKVNYALKLIFSVIYDGPGGSQSSFNFHSPVLIFTVQF